MRALKATVLLLTFLTPHTALADPVEDAAALLSRYPAGMMPVDPAPVSAIHTLAESGSVSEVPLLRSLAVNERAEIRRVASDALEKIRSRQVLDQREAFARELPNWPDLAPAAAAYLHDGVGREEAYCAAYADRVLGTRIDPPRQVEQGDARKLLAQGRPHSAAGAASMQYGRDARMLEAKAHEDMGDARGAVQRYALLAAGGDDEAHDKLDSYGVDVERLLLGVLSRPDHNVLDRNEAQVLDLLVRNGAELTVSVLAERTLSPVSSARVTAVDALTRMLDQHQRVTPLSEAGVWEARRALQQASRDELPSLREIAISGL